MKISKNIKILLITFFIILFVYSMFIKHEFTSTNESSRIGSIQSLVTEHSFELNTSLWYTNDKILINNHFYSDKPPTLAFIHSGVYWILFNFFHLDFSSNLPVALPVFVFIVIVCMSILSLIFFYKLLYEFGFSDRVCLIMTLILAFGTVFFPFSVIYNAHIVSAQLVIFSLYILNKKQTKLYHPILLGLFVGLNATVDILSGAFFLLFISIFYIFYSKKSRKEKILYCIFVSISIIFYLILNHSVTGNFIPGALQPTLFSYEGSTFSKSTLSGFYNHSSLPDLFWYAFNSLIGARGLFIYTPILLFSFLGFYYAWRNNYDHKLIICLIFYITLSVIFSILFSSDYSGNSFGIRWYVPLIPVMVFFISFYYDRIRNKKSRVELIIFYIIVAISVIISLIGAFYPWSYELFSIKGNIDYIVSSFRSYFHILNKI